jgi:hypothetical protein
MRNRSHARLAKLLEQTWGATGASQDVAIRFEMSVDGGSLGETACAMHVAPGALEVLPDNERKDAHIGRPARRASMGGQYGFRTPCVHVARGRVNFACAVQAQCRDSIPCCVGPPVLVAMEMCKTCAARCCGGVVQADGQMAWWHHTCLACGRPQVQSPSTSGCHCSPTWLATCMGPERFSCAWPLWNTVACGSLSFAEWPHEPWTERCAQGAWTVVARRRRTSQQSIIKHKMCRCSLGCVVKAMVL